MFFFSERQSTSLAGMHRCVLSMPRRARPCNVERCRARRASRRRVSRARQGSTVRLETAHAALLEGDAASWEDALAHGASCWRLVAMVTPDA